MVVLATGKRRHRRHRRIRVKLNRLLFLLPSTPSVAIEKINLKERNLDRPVDIIRDSLLTLTESFAKSV